MAKIAIINESPEIVALVSQAMTVGNHEFLKLIGATDFMLKRALDFAPDLFVLPLHRRHDSVNRPLRDYHDDIGGTDVLEMLNAEPAFADVPIILFGFFTDEADMPESYRRKIRYDAFLVFPTGLQELNPVISGMVGPAKGTRADALRMQGKAPPDTPSA